MWAAAAIALALVSGCVCVERAHGIRPSLDASRPVVRFSPTRETNDSLYANDGFGYSAAIHHTVENLTNLTLEEVLDQVRIIAGSPRGRFPGGYKNYFPDEVFNDQTVCDNAEPAFMGQTPNENKECFGVTGLVYMCFATNDSCLPFVGNGDKDTTIDADGYLYKRNPNVKLTPDFSEYSNQGLMGATMFSNGDYFLACAPRLSYLRNLHNVGPAYEPRGRCVFSDRGLKNFKVLDPCRVEGGVLGSATNHGGTGYCQAGTSAYISMSNKIILGTPGFDDDRGGIGYFNDLSSTGMKLGPFPTRGIPVFSSPPDRYSTMDFTYFGFDVVAGNFNGSEGVVTSSLRYSTQENSAGAVNIITDFGDDSVSIVDQLEDTVKTISSNQLVESFGKVLVVADLNGDGLDELVATAPTYSDSETNSPELGRAYILRNPNLVGELTFEIVAMLTGRAKFGRFGFSATNLGDLNNDGLEDIAISAPYEGPGVIYIYYGHATDYIHPSPHQTIQGQDMVDRVIGLDSLSTFGFFLQGNTDLDNNEYRDLLIGAEESQVVFVLRSRPVATINLTLTANVSSIVPTDKNCVRESDKEAYPCFTITVCGTYTGRGLKTFDANFVVSEVKGASAESRLLFGDVTPLSFNATETDSDCTDVIVYVTLDVSGLLGDLVMQVEMQQFPLPTEPVDSLLPVTDLSMEPVIESEPMQASVAIVLGCNNDTCISDLQLNFTSITYLNSSGGPYSNQEQLTVGAVRNVRVVLNYSNVGEVALGFQMLIVVPREFGRLNTEAELGVVTCLSSEEADMGENTTYFCSGFEVPLFTNESREITFILGVAEDELDGSEGTLVIPICIDIVNRAENTELPADTGNNQLNILIPVVAVAAYTLEVTYPQTIPTYVVEEVKPVVEQTNQLGSILPITVTFSNSGPSTLSLVTLIIRLPLRNVTDTDEYYYLYPIEVNDDANITCAMSDVLELTNPSRLTLVETRRRRRNLQGNVPGVMNHVLRTVRQTTPQVTLDCGRSPSSCATLQCNVSDIGIGSRIVLIKTRIDNRFFYNKEADYVLTTAINVVNHNSFVDTSGSTESASFPVTISMQPFISSSSGLPEWVIAVCIAAGIIFIILVAVILTLLIILHIRRRRKRGEHTVDRDPQDDIETFNEKAFDNPGTNAYMS